MKQVCLLIAAALLWLNGSAQADSALIGRLKAFDNYQGLQSDTLTPPNDRLTQKIKTLRAQNSGITISTFIQIKLSDEFKDTTKPAAFRAAFREEMTSGQTARLIENCVINSYRSVYSETEIDELIRFYRTSAGKKAQTEQIFLLLKTAKDAELLMADAKQRLMANDQGSKHH